MHLSVHVAKQLFSVLYPEVIEMSETTPGGAAPHHPIFFYFFTSEFSIPSADLLQKQFCSFVLHA